MDSSSALPPGFHLCLQDSYAERKACRMACTVDTCPLILSYWNYRPDIIINAVFAGISILLCFIVLIQGLRSRQFKMYTVVTVIGSVMMFMGYGARIFANQNPFSDFSFITQLSCLTLAPAFFAAGIYFSLSKIIDTVGPSNSRIKPKFVPRIFITCDVISLVLQAAGGGISAYRASQELPPDPGNYTLIAGLAFQSLTLLLFVILAIDFAIRTRRRVKQYGKDVLNPDPEAHRMRNSKLFKWLITSLAISALLIFIRSVYRIAELSEGWKGHLMSVEVFVVIWESVPVAIAQAFLCWLHPGFIFRTGKSANLAPISFSNLPPTNRTNYKMQSTTTSGISQVSVKPGRESINIKTFEMDYDDEGSSTRGSKQSMKHSHHV